MDTRTFFCGAKRAVVSSSFIGVGLAAILSLSVPCLAAEAQQISPSEMDELRALIEQQRQQIEEQRARLKALEDQVEAAASPRVTPAVYDPIQGPYRNHTGSSGVTPAKGESAPSSPALAQATQPEEEDERPPEIAVIRERGGVLTRGGDLQLEPSIEYTKSTSDRLNFRGISIVEGFLVGIIEASDTDRDTLTAALTARYGITNRLEIETKVPYVRRDDRVTSTVTGTSGAFSLTDEVEGDGLGDVEAALHYQINRGQDGWPFFIGNVRYKSTTGEGPFKVNRDSDGVPTELATGSGFHSVEPSLTAIFPSDPAVLFANVGYTFNIPDNVNEDIGGRRIGRVDPGDSIGVSFGLGVSLNQDLSFSLGYQHDFINDTTTEIDGEDFDSEDLSVGSMLFGASYRISDSVGINVSTAIGATEDAPDVQLILRVPITFNLF